MIRLECDGLDNLLLDTTAGWKVRQFDVGDPAPRPVVDDAPDADGSIDTTALIGPRAVTLGLRLLPDSTSLWEMRNQLRAFTSPRVRPTLFFTPPGSSDELRLTVRGSQFSDPVDNPIYRDVTVQWVAPLGIIESAVLHSAITPFSAGAAALGRAYSLTFDRVYPASDPQGSVLVTNAGTAHAYPLLRMYGPWADETLVRNEATGDELVFDAETVTAGNFLEVDTRAKTIRLNGNAADSRYDKLVYPDSTWWTLAPGTQRIRAISETSNPPAHVEVEWRDAWL